MGTSRFIMLAHASKTLLDTSELLGRISEGRSYPRQRFVDGSNADGGSFRSPAAKLTKRERRARERGENASPAGPESASRTAGRSRSFFSSRSVGLAASAPAREPFYFGCSEHLRMFPSAFFSVWRPTSFDALRRLVLREGVGKGLNVKGKSAKSGLLSGFVPFLQISANADVARVPPPAKGSRVRVYYRSEAARDQAHAILARGGRTASPSPPSPSPPSPSPPSPSLPSPPTAGAASRGRGHVTLAPISNLASGVTGSVVSGVAHGVGGVAHGMGGVAHGVGDLTKSVAGSTRSIAIRAVGAASTATAAALSHDAGSGGNGGKSGHDSSSSGSHGGGHGGGGNLLDFSRGMARGLVRQTTSSVLHVTSSVGHALGSVVHAVEDAVEGVTHAVDAHVHGSGSATHGIHTLDQHADLGAWGLELPLRLLWDVYVVQQDIAPPSEEWETGRPSEPAFMALNLHSLEVRRLSPPLLHIPLYSSLRPTHSTPV